MEIDDFSLLEQLDEEALQIYLDSTDFLIMDFPELSNATIEEYLKKLMVQESISEMNGMHPYSPVDCRTRGIQQNDKFIKLENSLAHHGKKIQLETNMISLPYEYILDFTETVPTEMMRSINEWIDYLKEGFVNKRTDKKKKGLSSVRMDNSCSLYPSKKVSFPSISPYNKSPILHYVDYFFQSFSEPQAWIIQNKVNQAFSLTIMENCTAKNEEIAKVISSDHNYSIVHRLTNTEDKTFTILEPYTLRKRSLTTNLTNLHCQNNIPCFLNDPLMENGMSLIKYISSNVSETNTLQKYCVDKKPGIHRSRSLPPSSLTQEEEMALQTSIENFLTTFKDPCI